MDKKNISLVPLALTALLCALACVLSFAESAMLPPLPLGVRLGLSNLCVLIAIELISVRSAASVVVFKTLFVFLTRGVTAFLMSVSGGVMSFVIALVLIKKTRASCVLVSSVSALFHNTGQIITAALLTGSGYTLWYFPFLCLTGVASGVVTGLLFYLIGTRLCKILPGVSYDNRR